VPKIARGCIIKHVHRSKESKTDHLSRISGMIYHCTAFTHTTLAGRKKIEKDLQMPVPCRPSRTGLPSDDLHRVACTTGLEVLQRNMQKQKTTILT
jgi:hypothetical protein